jgi:phosphomannomutase
LICSQLRRRIVIAFARSDTFIPVDTEAVSPETIALLKQASRRPWLDAIVSADGDGDRPLVTDETGTPLRGDLLGLIAANFLGASSVVTPVTSNSGIEAAGSFGVIRTRVGSPFVIGHAAGAWPASKRRRRLRGQWRHADGQQLHRQRRHAARAADPRLLPADAGDTVAGGSERRQPLSAIASAYPACPLLRPTGSRISLSKPARA